MYFPSRNIQRCNSVPVASCSWHQVEMTKIKLRFQGTPWHWRASCRIREYCQHLPVVLDLLDISTPQSLCFLDLHENSTGYACCSCQFPVFHFCMSRSAAQTVIERLWLSSQTQSLRPSLYNVGRADLLLSELIVDHMYMY